MRVATVLLLAALGDLAVGLPYQLRVVARAVAILLGVTAVAVVAFRSRGAWRMGTVALWLEERIPALDYALVTLIPLLWLIACDRKQPVAPVRREEAQDERLISKHGSVHHTFGLGSECRVLSTKSQEIFMQFIDALIALPLREVQLRLLKKHWIVGPGNRFLHLCSCQAPELAEEFLAALMSLYC